MSKFHKVKQLGFTIIELVIVIVILGILAAFAIPRFVDLAGSARVATVEGMRASVTSAANLAHAQWLADGGTASTVNMQGQTVNLAFGYPATTDIGNALGATDGFSFSAGTFTKQGASTPASCIVTYAAPTAANNTPSISMTTTGC